MNKIMMRVSLMEDIKNLKPFSEMSGKFAVTVLDIFRLGVLTYDPPENIKEDDFGYLQGKAPALEEFYKDNVKLRTSAIVTHAVGETAIKVSEIIGVGVGLVYATKLLKVSPNKIKKIGIIGKEKRLDFEVIKNNKKYEVETRSTSTSSKVKTMMAEVLAKKAGKTVPAIRFGVVTQSRKPEDREPSFVLVGDDNDLEKVSTQTYSIVNYLNYYLPILSLALDNHQYNILVKKLIKGKFRKNSIKIDKIKKCFVHKGIRYVGEAFDRRLILDYVRRKAEPNSVPEALLRNLTKTIGVHQIFIGLDENLIKLINSNDVASLEDYSGENFSEIHSSYSIGSIGDGVLILEISENAPKVIGDLLPRQEVKTRLSQVLGFAFGKEKPLCGAPCRSREIEGKPCEIRTYRGHCHFHR